MLLPSVQTGLIAIVKVDAELVRITAGYLVGSKNEHLPAAQSTYLVY